MRFVVMWRTVLMKIVRIMYIRPQLPIISYDLHDT